MSSFPDSSDNADPTPTPSEAVFNALLSLPDDEIVKKLRVMDYVQIVEFSLLSERCKELVKSIKIQGIRIHVGIGSEVFVHLTFKGRTCTFKFQYTNHGGPSNLKAPLHVAVHNEPNKKEKTIRKDQFEMRDWMEHFYTIFNLPGTTSIFLKDQSSGFAPEDMKKYFGVPSRLTMGPTGSYAHSQAVLQTFLPVESLGIRPNAFENSKIPPEILIQHFTDLIILFPPELSSVGTLEDLLTINSKSIHIQKRMSSKDINKFIKLWQHGANPQMEYLRIECKIEEDTILKGIKSMEIPKSEKRLFRFAERRDGNEKVRGGTDIWRMDGVKATIQFDYANCYVMYVWFDHCIV